MRTAWESLSAAASLPTGSARTGKTCGGRGDRQGGGCGGGCGLRSGYPFSRHLDGPIP